LPPWLLEGGVVSEGPPVGELLEIASASVPLLERARCLVERLDRWLCVDAIWLTLCDPQSHLYAAVGSAGLERVVLHRLSRPTGASEAPYGERGRSRHAISVTELPAPAEALPTWADCVLPTDLRDGLGVPLPDPAGGDLGTLSLLFPSSRPPSPRLRDQLDEVAPVLARGVSPMHSLLAAARLVRGATAGILLLRDGTTHPLPGTGDDPLLVEDARVAEVARRVLLAGQVFRSFLWPTPGTGPVDHARLTVIAATDAPPCVLGAVLVTHHAECRGLTPRELEVLGLLIAGRSNQQISSRLAIAPRTVATHVEHILQKLDVPTRTQAAVRASREGCYVPLTRRRRPRS
jgi:DNA-binding CsgD family transcriptional regulator